jgi:hypothetical protein
MRWQMCRSTSKGGKRRSGDHNGGKKLKIPDSGRRSRSAVLYPLPDANASVKFGVTVDVRYMRCGGHRVGERAPVRIRPLGAHRERREKVEREPIQVGPTALTKKCYNSQIKEPN